MGLACYPERRRAQSAEQGVLLLDGSARLLIGGARRSCRSWPDPFEDRVSRAADLFKKRYQFRRRLDLAVCNTVNPKRFDHRKRMTQYRPSRELCLKTRERVADERGGSERHLVIENVAPASVRQGRKAKNVRQRTR